MKAYQVGADSLARKILPRYIPPSDFRGDDIRDMDYNPNFECPYCRRQMHFYKQDGNREVYVCDGPMCQNNPDSHLKHRVDRVTKNFVGNQRLKWRCPEPII